MHSKCLTGDVFHSMRCDCGWQLDTAMEMIAAGRPRRDRLSRSGRAGHRPAQQAQGVRAAGSRRRHGRGERAARLQARPAQLRHRRADPARPRPQVHSADHQQSAQDGRPRGLRPPRRRARADRAAGARRERRLPAAPSATSSATCSLPDRMAEFTGIADRRRAALRRRRQPVQSSHHREARRRRARRARAARRGGRTTSTSCGCRARGSCRSPRVGCSRRSATTRSSPSAR